MSFVLIFIFCKKKIHTHVCTRKLIFKASKRATSKIGFLLTFTASTSRAYTVWYTNGGDVGVGWTPSRVKNDQAEPIEGCRVWSNPYAYWSVKFPPFSSRNTGMYFINFTSIYILLKMLKIVSFLIVKFNFSQGSVK